LFLRFYGIQVGKSSYFFISFLFFFVFFLYLFRFLNYLFQEHRSA